MKASEIQQGDIISVADREGYLTADPTIDETGHVYASGITSKHVTGEFVPFTKSFGADEDVQVLNRQEAGFVQPQVVIINAVTNDEGKVVLEMQEKIADLPYIVPEAVEEVKEKEEEVIA